MVTYKLNGKTVSKAEFNKVVNPSTPQPKKLRSSTNSDNSKTVQESDSKALAITRIVDDEKVTVTSGGKVTVRNPTTNELIERYYIQEKDAQKLVQTGRSEDLKNLELQKASKIKPEQPVYLEVTPSGLGKTVLVKDEMGFRPTNLTLTPDTLKDLSASRIKEQTVLGKDELLLNPETRRYVSSSIPTIGQTDISVIPKNNVSVTPKVELKKADEFSDVRGRGTILSETIYNIPPPRPIPTGFQAFKETADRGLGRIEFFTQTKSNEAVAAIKRGDTRQVFISGTQAIGSGFGGFFASVGLGLATRPVSTVGGFLQPLYNPEKFISNTISRAKSNPFGFSGELIGMFSLGEGVKGTPTVLRSTTKPINSFLFDRRISKGVGEPLSFTPRDTLLYEGQTQLVPKPRAEIIGDVRMSSKTSLRVSDLEIVTPEQIFRFGSGRQTTLSPRGIEFVKLESGNIIGRVIPTMTDLFRLAESRLVRSPKTSEVQTTLIREPFLTTKKTPKGVEITINQPLFAMPLGGLEFATAQAAGKVFEFVTSPKAKQTATLISETIKSRAPKPLVIFRGTVGLEKSLIEEKVLEDQKIKSYSLLLSQGKVDSKLAMNSLVDVRVDKKERVKVISLLDVKRKTRAKVIQDVKVMQDTMVDVKIQPLIERVKPKILSPFKTTKIIEEPYIIKPIKQIVTKRRESISPVSRGLIGKAFDVFVKKSGSYKLVGSGLSRLGALSLGARTAKTSLAASFKITPSRGFAKVSSRDDYFSRVKSEFRTFKKVKGRKVPLEDEFIQLRKFRLGTRSEVGAIQKARKSSSPFFKTSVKVGGFL